MTKKFVAGVLATMTISSAIYLKTTYQVLRVLDGDTFETVEHKKIRLSGVDTPELELCAGQEAKMALEKFIESRSSGENKVNEEGKERDNDKPDNDGDIGISELKKDDFESKTEINESSQENKSNQEEK